MKLYLELKMIKLVSEDLEFMKFEQVFNKIQSKKKFNLVKVQVTFERNNARDIFSSGIENCKYFCFIYTILDKEMQEKRNRY